MSRMLYQAITTKFLGPTNRLGPRCVAEAAAGRVFIYWDSRKKDDANHLEAAWTLARKYEWAGCWYGGGLKDGRRVFVQTAQAEEPLFITFGPDQK